MSRSATWTTEFKDELLEAGIDLIGVSSPAPFEVQGPGRRTVDPADALPDAEAVVIAGFNVSYPARPWPSESGAPRGRFPPYGTRIFRPMSAYCRKTICALLKKRGFRAVPAQAIPLKVAAARGTRPLRQERAHRHGRFRFMGQFRVHGHRRAPGTRGPASRRCRMPGLRPLH